MSNVSITFVQHPSLVLAEQDGKLYACADNLQTLSNAALVQHMMVYGRRIDENQADIIKRFVPQFKEENQEITYQFGF